MRKTLMAGFVSLAFLATPVAAQYDPAQEKALCSSLGHLAKQMAIARDEGGTQEYMATILYRQPLNVSMRNALLWSLELVHNELRTDSPENVEKLITSLCISS